MSPRRRSVPALLADVAVPAFATLVLLGVLALISWRRPHLWYDEAVSRLLIDDPSPLHMIRVIAAGGENNPPLYPLILRCWSAIAGTAPAALRLPSSLFIAGAFALLWWPLRKHVERWVAAVALGLTFFRADAILDQVAQARFYGLFLLGAAGAIACALETARRERVGRRLAWATALSHVVLVYSHTFGIAYSVAIAVALLGIDALNRRRRPVVLLPIAVAWILFIPWVPWVLEQGRMAQPRLWITTPGMDRLTGVMERLTSRLSGIIVALSAISWAWRRSRNRRHPRADVPRADVPRADAPRADASRADAPLWVGIAVVAVAPLVFVESLVGIPVFVDRYVLPSALGWPLLVAAGLRRYSQPGRLHPRAAAVGLLAFVTLGASALVTAANRESARLEIPSPSPGMDGAPIVVESAMDLLPLVVYDAERARYRFPLDWPLALDATSAPSSVQEYKLMALFARAGYLAEIAVDSRRLLCETPKFSVLESGPHRWLEQRVLADARLDARRDGASRLWIVERRAPIACEIPGTAIPEVHPAARQ